MSNLGFSPVSNNGCSAIDAILNGNDIDAEAFLSLVTFLHDTDCDLRTKMDEIKGREAEKKVISDEIQQLQAALRESKDGPVAVGGGINLSEEQKALIQKKAQELWVDVQKEIEGKFITVQVKGGTIDGIKENTYVGFNANGFDGFSVVYTREQVQNRIEELKTKMDSLNSNSQIALIELNRIINKRNEAIQLTSNICSSSHQSAMGIINNLK